METPVGEAHFSRFPRLVHPVNSYLAIGGGSASRLLNPTSTFRLGVGVVGFLMTLALSIILWQQHTRVQRLINQLPEVSS